MQVDCSEQATGNSAFSASSDSFITTKVHAHDSHRTSPKLSPDKPEASLRLGRRSRWSRFRSRRRSIARTRTRPETRTRARPEARTRARPESRAAPPCRRPANPRTHPRSRPQPRPRGRPPAKQARIRLHLLDPRVIEKLPCLVSRLLVYHNHRVPGLRYPHPNKRSPPAREAGRRLTRNPRRARRPS